MCLGEGYRARTSITLAAGTQCRSHRYQPQSRYGHALHTFLPAGDAGIEPLLEPPGQLAKRVIPMGCRDVLQTFCARPCLRSAPMQGKLEHGDATCEASRDYLHRTEIDHSL